MDILELELELEPIFGNLEGDSSTEAVLYTSTWKLNLHTKLAIFFGIKQPIFLNGGTIFYCLLFKTNNRLSIEDKVDSM